MGKYDNSIGLAEKLLEEDKFANHISALLDSKISDVNIYSHAGYATPINYIKIAQFYQIKELTEAIRDLTKVCIDNQQILKDIKEELKLNKTK